MPEDNNKAWQAQLNELYGIADASAEPKTQNPAVEINNSIEPEIVPVEYEEYEGDNGELACAVCGNAYPQEKLTVVSHERFNFESAVVACPICLENMKQEVKQRTNGANLGMASLWAFLIFLFFTIVTSLLIWFNKSLTIEMAFRFIGAYLAIFPGFAIGKAVYYASGQKESLAQRLMAVGFTALYLYISFWVACSSFLNYQFDIIRPNGHDLLYVQPLDILFIYIPQLFSEPILADKLWLPFAVLGASLAGLVAAYFSSGGEKLYTRPYIVKPAT
jgi:uncharacterized protein YbaR (Trm112 family)